MAGQGKIKNKDFYEPIVGHDTNRGNVDEFKNWTAVPVPPNAKNDCMEMAQKTLPHIAPLFLCWILLSVLISPWDLLVFPGNFLWALVVGLYYRYKRHADVYLKYQFQTFSWSLWVGSLMKFICVTILLIILFFVCMSHYLNDLKDMWDARPSQNECDYYGSQGSEQCENQGCVVVRGDCLEPNGRQFLAANSEFFRKKAGVWIMGILMAVIVAFLEEGIKYYWMRRACLVNLPKPDHMSRIFIETVLSFGIVAGLGIGIGEACMYTLFVLDDAFVVMGTIVYHLIWKTPFHMVTGFLTACNLTRNMLMNQQYDMPWYRCILESTIYHAAYDLFNFFIYMLLLEYTSSVTIILFLNMLMNGIGVFLGFRAKKLLEDELMNYQLHYNPTADDFDDEDFKKGGGGPEPIAMGYRASSRKDEEDFGGRTQFTPKQAGPDKGSVSKEDLLAADRLANQVPGKKAGSLGGGYVD